VTPTPCVRVDTERLTLREFDDGDLAPLAVILSDPRVMEYSVAGRMSVDAVRDFLVSCRRSYEAHGFGQWAVVEPASGRLLGFCGISRVRLDERDEVELAYRLAAGRWGQGLASEAGAAVLAAAFARWQLPSVVAIIADTHAASRRVAEKLGMVRDHATRYRGWDVVVYRRYGDPDGLPTAIESR
jgi:RimJ/RimL family protein N-acetyltransferase